jgi:CheY-like chemotaxis protein
MPAPNVARMGALLGATRSLAGVREWLSALAEPPEVNRPRAPGRTTVARGSVPSAETVPAVLVTDLMMPVMDGRALVRAWRDAPATASLPIVLMSAALPILLDGLARLGVQETVSKPIDTDVLVAMIARLLAGTLPLR